MTSFKARIIASGRITVPKSVIEELDLYIGDYVQVENIKKLVPEANPKED